ncbi:MAG: hypothetical protein RL701_3651 [Pseudomonadota bacterium]
MATFGFGSSSSCRFALAVGLWLSASSSSYVAAEDEMPRFTGNGSITQAINGDLGAILDLGGGITMTFPKGIPVGRSRVVTFKKAAKKPAGPQVQKGFTPAGAALEFSTPLSSGDSPIVLSLPMKADPRKKTERLVLAVEVGTLCTDENKSTKGKNGLCSGWELIDAEFQSSGQLVAKLQSTGGLRLQFGTVPQS